ncbi:GNAT family N-acetyltransferase [Aliidiomarina celeris]|uniref:GNAT family N-acetyltransferase n=1 Tax=Aliidiomarina celeris TaxID=2249428 RepID=UPI000DE93457|nr:GNAT family N-acetyltransferase [Aliidiomarina celeris]
MKLILPNESFAESYHQYIAELGKEERYPFPLDFDASDFAALLERIENFRQGINLPEGYVPSTTYWLVSGDKLVGVSNLRHHLNERIAHAGGHIGLGIRPSERGKGFGNLLMKLTIEQAKARGIQPVHIHCYADNQASAKTIRANGGELHSEITDGGHTVQRYIYTF